MIKHFVSLFLSGLLVWGAAAQTTSLRSFPLTAVRLLDGPFREAQQTDLRYILELDADRLLAPFLREAGLPARAASYGNWENTGLDGHIGGHYLSALSLMYASTGDAVLKQRLDHMVEQLARCQQANGDGYVGGIPGGKAMWKDIAAGKIEAGSFSLNGKWVPLYNIHKLYAGLYDAWVIAGNQRAKTVLMGLMDWCLRLVANLSDEQVQQMLRSEHGGLNEVFADVAAATLNQQYLALARRFSDRRILDPLLQQRDALTGLHANTQIPKVIGYQHIAQVARESSWNQAAQFFWQTVVNHRTVSIGGNSVREHFHPSDNFSSMIESREGPESCNSYNMLKLTRGLFLARPSGAYMDYYERTLYNHILSSQRPTGGFVYFTPMRPGHYRVYSEPQDGFWCCVGSGLENHGKYGELIYAHDAKDVYVNLFIPSQLTWRAKGIVLTQQTRFPFEESSSIVVKVAKPTQFGLRIRIPRWTRGDVPLSVNGKAVKPVMDTAAGYALVERTWRSGDRLTISLPMHTAAETLPDRSQWVSFVHGPIVLAAVLDTNRLDGLLADGSRMGHIAAGPLEPLDEAPLAVGEFEDSEEGSADLDKQLLKENKLQFRAAGLFDQARFKGLHLQPFFTVHNSRYAIYFPFTTMDSLPAVRRRLKEQEGARLALDAATADVVHCGEQQPETDHQFKGEKTESGLFRERAFRNAKGWFSYNLRNTGGQGRKLRVTYYGRERNRQFDVFVNDLLLATVRMESNGGDKFVDMDYALPDNLLSAAPTSITVKFTARDGAATANIFEVRLLK